MSSEPPFDHPPDHTRYGDPPPPPPSSLPRFFTPTYKISCALVFGFLLTQCCLCGGIGSVHQEVKNRLDTVDRKLEEINKKLEEANKKPGDVNKKPDEIKKDEGKKDDK